MNRQILRLAIPNILSNLSVPLLGIVDTALMGRMESEIYIGAVAIGSVILSFIYWGFGFLRMGTTGLTAQAYGQADPEAQIMVLARAFLVAMAASILIVLLQWPIGEGGFLLIPGEADVIELGKEYFYIRIFAAPATIGLYAFHGWFLGMQNARFPMLLTLFVNIANVLFNFWFVFGMGMKSDGVAWGTVVAQYLGIALAIGLFFLKYRGIFDQLKISKIGELKELKHFFSVNRDIFIRTIFLIFVFGFFTAQSSGMDATTLAANQILLQYFYTMSFAVDGFAYAAESLVGRFVGEKNGDMLRKSIRLLLIWGVGFGLIFTAVYLTFGTPLLHLFTDQPAVIAAAKPYMYWMGIFPLAGAIAFMWDGIYIGATAARPMRDTMFVATVLIFLPVFYLTFPTLGNHALWLAMTVFMAARSLFLSLMAKKHIFSEV